LSRAEIQRAPEISERGPAKTGLALPGATQALANT
jgi:hypothetical protein